MIKAIALLTPIYITLFWCLNFFIQKKNFNTAKTTLGFFMLLAFLLYSSHAIFFNNLYHIYSFVESIYILVSLMLYPTFYSYIQQLAHQEIKIKAQIISYLPAFILCTITLILTFILSPEKRIVYVKDALIEKNLKHLNLNTLVGLKGMFLLISRIIFIVQTLVYLSLSIKTVNTHNQRITNYFSDTNGRRLNWVRDVSKVILIVSIAGIVFALIGRSYFVKHEILLLIPSLLFGTIFFEIGFKGNQQQPIPEEFVADDVLKVEFEEIETAEEDELKKQLIELFETSKIYRQSDLRITTVSESIGTNRTYISRLINDEFNMNFNEFVNQYRIKEAKQHLSCKEHNSYTMEYIAEKSGFGSVASFSRVFKEVERTTPGKYRLTQKGKD